MNSTDFPNVNVSSNSTMVLFPPLVDKIVNGITLLILFITMVSLGCTMEISKIKVHIVRPKGVAIAVLAQYGVMPLTAFFLAKLFQLKDIESVAVLICGCCPGGNLSNIFSLALKGDMNLSIVMTTCSTVLALGMMPLLLYLYCKALIPNAESVIPYTGIIVALLMTIVPCAIGIFINAKVPRYSKIITKIGVILMLIATVVIGVIAGMNIGAEVWTLLSPRLIGTSAFMPLIGYFLGYFLSGLLCLNDQCKRTVSMETGCQNTQLCTAILKVAFPPELIGSLFLFPLIYILFQAVEALIFIVVFRCYEKIKSKMNNPKTNADNKLKEVNLVQHLIEK
ncbi:hepatic sodium/bile acid cotransporter-like [Erpetoichthys calabaricus]|uniref:Hepatic sodium/bile acid cotransporter n=1 Tax=Erpetoichthys calabaricus TaxID=27687 RepID=A0A8C4SK43_ERPCA|nr:hepatic sodium/bile acid cotransporter-like [Erpetoichthys calabaricus]